ncbi:hypothetical protein [Thioclava dalianensis]|jgi:hypothetical protein|nr:hypothetical protein [Thioclava dalianensis]
MLKKMADVTLDEGHLRFEFKDVDFAEQYDGWRHHRNVFSSACGGAKAVDFVVGKGNVIWLIEVKDYRHHRRDKTISLWDEIAIKVRDTMAGLVSTKFIGVDDDERRTSRTALGKRKLHVALHLEQTKNPSRLFPQAFNPANVRLKLKQNLRFADLHPVVFDRTDFPAQLGRVTSI